MTRSTAGWTPEMMAEEITQLRKELHQAKAEWHEETKRSNEFRELESKRLSHIEDLELQVCRLKARAPDTTPACGCKVTQITCPHGHSLYVTEKEPTR